jgi:hypothetical protein
MQLGTRGDALPPRLPVGAHSVRNVLAKFTLLRNVNSAEISRQCSVLT